LNSCNPRLVVIGSVDFSNRMLSEIILGGGNVVGVVAKASMGINADFFDLSITAQLQNIPYHKTNDINNDSSAQFISQLQPDYLICVGWSQLLHSKILKIAKSDNIGYHPSELPYNRGRHPVIWSLALGLKKTASTFFSLRLEPDSGPIFAQDLVVIDRKDDAASLLWKLEERAAIQIRLIIKQIKDGQLRGERVAVEKGNIWRRRGEIDGSIDFRMHSSTIYNLTRALSRPYVGAHIKIGDKKIRVWRVKEEQFGPCNIEPGKVLAIKNGNISVKTADGSVLLVEHEISDHVQVGSYL
jgi:methionyl-tRNA formyltransferase